MATAKRDATARAQAMMPALEEALYRAETEGVLEGASHVAVMAALPDVMVIRTFTRVVAADAVDVQQPTAPAARTALVIPYGARWRAFAHEVTGSSGDVSDVGHTLAPLLAPATDDYALLARETQSPVAASVRVEALERAVAWADATAERLDVRDVCRDTVDCTLLCGDLAPWEPITVMASRLFPCARQVVRADWCREGGDACRPGGRGERVRRVREVGVALDKLLETDGEGNLALEPLLRGVTERYWTAVADEMAACWQGIAREAILYWQVSPVLSGPLLEAYQYYLEDDRKGTDSTSFGSTVLVGYDQLNTSCHEVALHDMLRRVEWGTRDMLIDALIPLLQELPAPFEELALSLARSRDSSWYNDALVRYEQQMMLPWFMRWLAVWGVIDIVKRRYSPYSRGQAIDYEVDDYYEKGVNPFARARALFRTIKGWRRPVFKASPSDYAQWAGRCKKAYGSASAFHSAVDDVAHDGAMLIRTELLRAVRKGLARARGKNLQPWYRLIRAAYRHPRDMLSPDDWNRAYDRGKRFDKNAELVDDQLLGPELAAGYVLIDVLARTLVDADPWRAFSTAEWKALARLEERLEASLGVLPAASPDA